MTARDRSRIIASILLLGFVFFPFAVIFSRLPWSSPRWEPEVTEVIAWTALQAALSAGFSLLFGFIGAGGLLWAHERWQEKAVSPIEWLALLPNIVPVILLLLSFFKLMGSVHGLAGIVFIHTLLNTGTISVVVSRLARARLIGLSEVAWTLGSSRKFFLFKVAFPFLAFDLAVLLLFIFALSFTSFAIPLAVGGRHSTTVEVLIYQRLRIESDWTNATWLAFLQSLAIVFFSWRLAQRTSTSIASAESTVTVKGKRVFFLSWAPGLVVALFPSIFLLIGFFSGLNRSFIAFFKQNSFDTDFVNAFTGSMVVGVGTGLLTFLLLFLYSFATHASPRSRVRRLLLGLTGPSAALTGFALLVVWRSYGLASLVKIAIGTTLLAFPALLRLEWDAKIQGIAGQIAIAETLGANAPMIFWRIVIPQLARSAGFLSGLTSIWAWGDFALSSVIAERPLTLALQMQAMIESYRLESASFLAWFLLFGGLITYAFFIGVGNVLGSKS